MSGAAPGAHPAGSISMAGDLRYVAALRF